MADVGMQAMTAGNATIKNWLEFYRMTIDLIRELLRLIPEQSVANTMRDELEKGHIDIDIIHEEDKEQLKEALRKKGMIENKDYMFGTYHAQDGTAYTALFYNISDREKVRGEMQEIDPTGSAKKEAVEFFSAMKERGINPDSTFDVKVFNQYCHAKGFNFDYGNMSKEDLDLAAKLIDSEFNHLTDEQKNIYAKKLAQSGAIQAIYAMRTAGNIPQESLLSLASSSKDAPQIMKIQNLSEEQAWAINKRAEMYGLRISIDGPSNNQYNVYYLGKEQDLMKRVFIDSNYDLRSKSGEIYKNQLQFENKNTQLSINTVINKTYPDETKIPNGSMLVGGIVEPMRNKDGSVILDSDGKQVMGRQTLEVANGNFLLNQETKKIDPTMKGVISQDSKDCAKVIQNLFSDTKPTLLNPQDAERYKHTTTEKERASIVLEAQMKGEHGLVKRPEITKEDLEILKTAEKERQLYEDKLKEKDPGLDKIPSHIDGVSPLNTYISDQAVNDKFEHDVTEVFSKGNNFMDKSEMETSEFAEEMKELADDVSDQIFTFEADNDATNDVKMNISINNISLGRVYEGQEEEVVIEEVDASIDDSESIHEREELGNEF